MGNSETKPIVSGYGVSIDTNPKHRSMMEDEHVADDKFFKDTAYFGVYDGHGGNICSIAVREVLHKHVWLSMKKSKGGFFKCDMDKAFKEAYEATDKKILEVTKASDKSGSTAVSAVIQRRGKERYIFTANAGDARIVLCRDGKGERLTVDHKPSNEDEHKRITDMGCAISEKGKVGGVLAITRSFGDRQLKKWIISEPFTKETIIQEQDTHLIIACDGLWDVVTDDEVAALIKENKDKTPQELSDLLVKTALEKGTTDNLSIIVVAL